ncbi:MAG: type II toxin-antitoxin system PemK/MazF family toxin [Acidimicrobiales bacterium]
MVVQRGEVYWVDLGEPKGSRPAKRRPVLIVSDDLYNSSKLATVVAVTLTGTLRLGDMPGNVRIAKGEAGMTRPSVANVTALVTLDKTELGRRLGRARPLTMESVDEGLREVLGL